MNKKGYTLIEISLVLALLGITLSLGLPKFRQALLTDPLKSSARKIIGTVQQLRAKTVREQVDWFLCFDFTENLFWAERVTGKSQPTEKRPVRLADNVRIYDIWQHKHGTISQGILKVRFTKKGYVNQTIIHLSDNSGRKLSLFLEPFLGTIKLAEGYTKADD